LLISIPIAQDEKDTKIELCKAQRDKYLRESTGDDDFYALAKKARPRKTYY